MRIVHVHNAYSNAGGEDRVVASEREILLVNGEYVESCEFSNDHLQHLVGFTNHCLAAGNTVWSRQSLSQVQRAISHFKPDVLSAHNFFPTASPSIYSAVNTQGAAVVQTLHNYRLLCPNSLFFRNGNVCEDCIGKLVPWPGVAHACYRDSRAATAVAAAMLTAHRARRTWQNEVDLFIALTEFSRSKFIEGGLPPDRIVAKPNFLAEELDPTPGGEGFLFVGRLDESKGIKPMLDAWSRLTAINLTVIGDGPMLETVHDHAANMSSVEIVGRKPREIVFDAMKNASALVFPSLWYEAFPMTIIEAFATGLPVIASRLGSMEEIIVDGLTGLQFESGNAEDLAAKVRWASEHPEEMTQMGINARAEYESKYTAEIGYKNLMSCYEQAILIRKYRSE